MEGDGMSTKRGISQIAVLGVFLMMGAGMNANAGLFGLGGTSWKEEVLLHDGGRIVVERRVERGGRHEIGQKPPYKEQSLQFTLPATGQAIKWEDRYSEDIGMANFLPMAIDVVNGTSYLVASPAGCLSYNKWGRPNPPYVIFKYVGNQWVRIPLQELPTEIKAPNLIVSAPDLEVEKIGKSPIPVDEIKRANAPHRQPEYRSILREAVRAGTEGSSVNCDELVFYKGAWVGPGDSIGKRMMDMKAK